MFGEQDYQPTSNDEFPQTNRTSFEAERVRALAAALLGAAHLVALVRVVASVSDAHALVGQHALALGVPRKLHSRVPRNLVPFG